MNAELIGDTAARNPAWARRVRNEWWRSKIFEPLFSRALGWTDSNQSFQFGVGTGLPGEHATTMLDARLAAATAELDRIASAAARVAESQDPRAEQARALLADARTRAEARVSFLRGLIAEHDAREAAFEAAVDAVATAKRALAAAEPEDAPARHAEVVAAEAAARKAHRAGEELIAAWRASAADVAPELVAAERRTEEVVTALVAAFGSSHAPATIEDSAWNLAAETAHTSAEIRRRLGESIDAKHLASAFKVRAGRVRSAPAP